ncbi:hypothetical protein OIU78_023800 [Salix suchowensis]|nr:hypothetical protein OIU78_023800 [Salix suchowensis]
MQTINPKAKAAAHPAEAHKNSYPAHLNNNPDPDAAEPTDCPDTTAPSAKEDTTLIRAKGKSPFFTENNSNTILGIDSSNEDIGECIISIRGTNRRPCRGPFLPSPQNNTKEERGEEPKGG